jgi:radical SAM/Cys-rich protein
MTITPGTHFRPSSSEPSIPIPTFAQTLAQHNRHLTRLKTTNLQVNLGLLCNQECRHCHLEAGPHRSEIMTEKTVEDVLAFAQREHFQVVDITGGAPELNPSLPYLIREMSGLVPKILCRSNLTALTDKNRKSLPALFTENRVVIIASLPSLNGSQADAQRGPGVFPKSIEALQWLNALGYGQENSGLELNLVSNPVGAFLPAPQVQTEERFRLDLKNKWGVVFNHLYTFANVPLGRFLRWLDQSNNLETYLQKLAQSFNAQTLEGVMCRTMVSVSWDGFLFDCDFNLAQGLYLGGKKQHLSEMKNSLKVGRPIAVSDHCYACTAGTGFT